MIIYLSVSVCGSNVLATILSLRLSVVLFSGVFVGMSRLSAVAVSFSCLEFLISDTKQEVSRLNQCVTHEKVMKREWRRAEMKDGRAVVIIHLFWDFLSFIDWTWDQRMSLIPRHSHYVMLYYPRGQMEGDQRNWHAKRKGLVQTFHFTGNDAPVIALSVWPDVIFICQKPGQVNPTKIRPLILYHKS